LASDKKYLDFAFEDLKTLTTKLHAAHYQVWGRVMFLFDYGDLENLE
jgi:hypothetical protein